MPSKKNWKKKYKQLLKERDDKLAVADKIPINEKAEKLKKENFPLEIYQYRTFDKSGENFKKGKIWVSHPKFFNDPYDTKIFYFQESMEKDVIQAMQGNSDCQNEFKLSDKEWKQFKRYISITDFPKTQKYSKIIKQIKFSARHDEIPNLYNNLRVCCFSEDNTNLLMWGHYADNHKGFCIGYEINKLCEKYRNHLYPIIYQKALYKKNLHEGTAFLPFLGDIVKYKDWQYEEEWRFILNPKNHTESVVVSTLEKINIEQPTTKGGFVDNFNASAIYLGSKISKENELIATKYANEKNIDIYKMEISKNKYKIVVKKL